ncbi:hypothetical protein ACQUQU_00810 [Thalassolituus sp. LLYu03]|uniref:hypothetical protein n=1 Tax=Thalassolituus sp. LLYu03 TaxID=3421656 RepID=UPI003D29D104
MREQQRLDYLQAMGITQWIPRQPLPFAPAPRWLAEDAHPRHAAPHQVAATGHMPHPLAAELLHDALPAATQKVPTVQAAAPRALVQEAVTAQPVASGAAPALVSELPAGGADLAPPRFELHFLRAGSGCWITDSADEAARVQAFAWRVLSAIKGGSDFIAAPVCFRWPFIESAHEDQSLPVALHALRTQWQFLAEQGIAYVIAVGAGTSGWLDRIDVRPLYHSTSLDALMSQATEKRKLWLALHQQAEL